MLTIDKIRAYAKENYNNGGDFIVECWSDSDIQDFLARGGTLRELAKMFSERREHFLAAEYYGGYSSNQDKKMVEEEEFIDDPPEKIYRSCTNGDYSPGNPWDAPGMSIHDFI